MMIFTEELADILVTLGFKLEYKTAVAWCFEDSELLESTVIKILDVLESVEPNGRDLA